MLDTFNGLRLHPLRQRRAESAAAKTSDSSGASREQAGEDRSPRNQLTAVAATAVVAALACGVRVQRVGDSGARASCDTPASSAGR